MSKTTVLDVPLVADESWVRRASSGGILVRVNALVEDLSPEAHAKLFAAAPNMAQLILDEEYAEVWDPETSATRLSCRRCGNRNFDGHKDDCVWALLMKRAGLL